MDQNRKLFWYSRRGLWILYLVSAFPIHLWTIILILNDFAWVSERTNVWDAIGVGAYGLLYAFMESAVVWLVIILLGFLLPRGWDEQKRIAMLSVLYWVAALWAIGGQLYFLLEMGPPPVLVQFLVESGRPLRLLYGAAFLLVGATVFVPLMWLIRSSRAVQVMQEVIERVSLLTIIYLFFDLIAGVVVLVRNL